MIVAKEVSMVTPAATPPAEEVGTRYLRATPVLDYRHPRLQALVAGRRWADIPEFARIGAIYDFVRDEIAFGYNASDDLPASAVLADGYGQCDTKATLLTALLRATGIPCRLHGATVTKPLQRGIAPEILYRFWRADIRHSWVEVLLDGRWVALEGVILDRAYLDGVRAKVGDRGGCLGYAVGTDDLADPPVQ
jgi:transglutaminase-like putative cysteine protease